MNATEEKELSAVESAEQAMREAAAAGGTAGETEPEKESVDGEKTERLICFVCTGNTCRSPMAAAVVNSRRTDEHPIRAISRGLAATVGAPMSEGARHALIDAGIESTADNPWQQHHAAQIDEEPLKRADLVVGISASHAFALITAFPLYAEKITSMPCDIPDPYGSDDETYRRCLAAITEGIGTLLP